MMLRSVLVTALLAASSALVAAAPVIITPSDVSWGNPSGENSGGGSSAITGAMPRSGNGSLEMHGDRTRYVGLGNFYSPASNLGLLSDVLQLSFDWAIGVGSVATLSPDYTPALRLHVWDGNQRSELIWEGAYNGTYGNTTQGGFYTSSANDLFYRYQTGSGVTFANGPGTAQVNQTISDWISGASSSGAQWYSDTAYVSAISVGAGSSAGAGYFAFADNVVFNTTSNERTFNFELTQSQSVPEPASLALVGLALLAGAGVRARKTRART